MRAPLAVVVYGWSARTPAPVLVDEVESVTAASRWPTSPVLRRFSSKSMPWPALPALVARVSDAARLPAASSRTLIPPIRLSEVSTPLTVGIELARALLANLEAGVAAVHAVAVGTDAVHRRDQVAAAGEVVVFLVVDALLAGCRWRPPDMFTRKSPALFSLKSNPSSKLSTAPSHDDAAEHAAVVVLVDVEAVVEVGRVETAVLREARAEHRDTHVAGAALVHLDAVGCVVLRQGASSRRAAGRPGRPR